MTVVTPPTKALADGTDLRASAAELPPFDSQEVVRHKADAHRTLRDAEGAEVGRCSLWWQRTPFLPSERLGLIGHYAAASFAASRELLHSACAELATHGCTLAVGPMDGSTWRRYRWVSDPGGGEVPAFFLEPQNPPAWPAQFTDAGFAPLAHYCSACTDRLEIEDPKVGRAERRLGGLGIRFRSLDPARWKEELSDVYRLTTAGFAGSFLYEPLPEAEFLADYEPLRCLVEPRLVTFAMHGDRAVGFVFCLPDWQQARRGEPVDTAILKTCAVVPDRAYAGLGSTLVQQTHRAARALGFRRMIHALMHEANASLNISARYAKPFRRYTLFAKSL